ncbi:PQQ-binding-like beta-propeller repeat protein [Krasilnikovia sp. MM14-A1259]|uniref:outer membrane protein assembly factor BamB family protein n=1 Tax=Krasilnikovia sp. MM14-A1259 TaxID=3373539 RepID=UPI00382092FA
MVAALLVGASGGCRRETVASAPSGGRQAVEAGTARCDSALPAAGAAQLPVLHRRDQQDSDNFVTTAAAFRGDARVGPAAWWVRPDTMGGTVKFAGPDRLVIAGQSGAASWTVGGVSVRNPADRWARASSGELPVAGSFVEVPAPVVVGTTVVTSVPQQVRHGDTTQTVAVVCGIDAANGHVRWGTQVPFPTTGSDESVTLLATGGAVVVVFGQGADLVGLTAATGQMRWHATVGVPATVTASGGLLVLSPVYAEESRSLAETRALDLGDGHVAWRHPMPTSANPIEHRTVVATAAGQPVVVQETVDSANGTTRDAKVQLIAYGADGSVRWKQASDPTGRIDAVDDLLIETVDRTESAPQQTTTRRVADGAAVWRARLNQSLGDVAASGTRLFLAAGDLRSLVVVDRHGGAVATSLAGVMMNLGKSGIPPDLTVADQTLMVTVGGTAVGFGLR